MKYSFKILAIMALALLASACYFKAPKNGTSNFFGLTRGDGNVIDKEYVVENFDKIHNTTGLDIRFAQDSCSVVKVHADSNIVELLNVYAEDGVLTIKADEQNLILEGDKYIYVACPSIKEVRVSGSGDFEMRNFMLDSLNMKFSGSGDIFMENGSLSCLSISSRGSGDVEMDSITCSSKTEISTAGSGDIDIEGIDGQDLECSAAGSGDVSISGAVKNIKASTAGSGDIDISNLKYENKEVSSAGSGDIITE